MVIWNSVSYGEGHRYGGTRSVMEKVIDMVELGGLAGKWRGYMEPGQLERQS